ncbi:MAG: AraC family transcriptional regulator [Gemmataceae bacterium]|nr:AraC family transcriptional regulator [Gemmataceae bacterium]
MRSSRSVSEASTLSAQYIRFEPGALPTYSTIGYFCPTARPVRLLVTDHHPPGRTSLVHSHPCVAFHGCLQGPITLLMDEGPAALDVGTCYLFGAGVRHHWRNDGPDHAVLLSLLVEEDRPGAWPVASGVAAGCRELKQRVQGAMRFEARGDAAVQQAFWQLADSLQPERPRTPLLITGQVWTLIGLLLEHLRSAAPGGAARLDVARQIQRLLVRRIQDRLSLAEIAGSVHLSPSRAKELFRAAFGCGIMAYFNQLKVQQAKRLLCDPSLTVKEVSRRLGFTTPAYFDRVFVRHTGQLPTAFRKG